MTDLQKIVDNLYTIRADIKLRKEELDGVLSFTCDDVDSTVHIVRSRAAMYSAFLVTMSGLIDMVTEYQFKTECPHEKQLLDQVLSPKCPAHGDAVVWMTPEESEAKRRELTGKVWDSTEAADAKRQEISEGFAKACQECLPPLRDHPDNKGRTLDLTAPTERPKTMDDLCPDGDRW